MLKVQHYFRPLITKSYLTWFESLYPKCSSYTSVGHILLPLLRDLWQTQNTSNQHLAHLSAFTDIWHLKKCDKTLWKEGGILWITKYVSEVTQKELTVDSSIGMCFDKLSTATSAALWGFTCAQRCFEQNANVIILKCSQWQSFHAEVLQVKCATSSSSV